MTRATLLHVLDHTTALGPAEVRELEQLAQAFPYCQTAHLLLAKAAHDQGTMLAGQRLRRAATYAADRTLLRCLIEQVGPAKVAESNLIDGHSIIEVPAPALEIIAVAPADTPAPVAPVMAAAETLVATPELVAAAPIIIPIEATSADATVPGLLVEPTVVPEPEPIVMVLQLVIEPVPEPVAEQQPNVPEDIAPVLLDQAGATILTTAEGPELLPTGVPTPAMEPDLPAQAPAIRPPVEVGEARFEFGLADTPPPAVPTTYELPSLIDEWAAAAVTLNMGSVTGAERLTQARNKVAPVAVIFTPAAFTGDAAVGYGFGESSRLGLSLQLLNLLTDSFEATAAASTQMAAAQPPATPLPPSGTFFEPDPLLLEHWAMHCPPVPAVPSSFDLINNFLRRQPRLTRPAMLPPTPSAQADLSVRSTRAEHELVSESLAAILVRQGKTARAIEIYEKLMVKQPEKMAYFAAQIQQLQPPA